jgi:hypothetical protein
VWFALVSTCVACMGRLSVCCSRSLSLSLSLSLCLSLSVSLSLSLLCSLPIQPLAECHFHGALQRARLPAGADLDCHRRRVRTPRICVLPHLLAARPLQGRLPQAAQVPVGHARLQRLPRSCADAGPAATAQKHQVSLPHSCSEHAGRENQLSVWLNVIAHAALLARLARPPRNPWISHCFCPLCGLTQLAV